jgi:hypothetical protein
MATRRLAGPCRFLAATVIQAVALITFGLQDYRRMRRPLLCPVRILRKIRPSLLSAVMFLLTSHVGSSNFVV